MSAFRLVRLPVPQFLFALLLLLLGGCASELPGHGPTYVFVIDYSKSTDDIRRQEVGVMLAELEDAPRDSTIIVFRMGYTTEEIYAGPLGDTGIDTLTSTVMREVSKSDPTPGTNFAEMAKALEAFGLSGRSDCYNLRILTDGANDFTDSKANVMEYGEAAAKVAENPHLSSLIFYGVKPGYREALRSIWGKAGSRLRILSQDQMIGE
jgi:hypothetical protein